MGHLISPGGYRPRSNDGISGASPGPPRSLTRGDPESLTPFARAWWWQPRLIWSLVVMMVDGLVLGHFLVTPDL